MAAARAWASGSLIDRGGAARDEEALADARLWALPASDIEALVAALGDGQRFGSVWADNRPAVDAFLIVASQWRTAFGWVDGRPRTLWIGLDYAGAQVALAARRVELTDDLMVRLQVMEIAARETLNGRAER